jgi:hypothetical protein
MYSSPLPMRSEDLEEQLVSLERNDPSLVEFNFLIPCGVSEKETTTKKGG